MIAEPGASGHLGRLIVSELLGRNVPAEETVAVVRTPERGALYTDSDELRRLVGRPTTSLTRALTAALRD